MRNKYILFNKQYDPESDDYKEASVREVVADAVVNNEGFLTFFNMSDTPAGESAIVMADKLPPTLVEIVSPDFWTRLENTGAYIAPSNTGVAPEGDTDG